MLAQREKSIMVKKFLFSLISVVVVPALALSSIGALFMLAYGTHWCAAHGALAQPAPRSQSALLRSEWHLAVGHAFVAASGEFALLYLVHASMLGAGAQLLQLKHVRAHGRVGGTGGSAAFTPWRSAGGHTRVAAVLGNHAAGAASRCGCERASGSPLAESCRRRAQTTHHFRIGYYYALRITAFGLVLIFSCVVPAVIPLGIVYFALLHAADRRLFNREVRSTLSDVCCTPPPACRPSRFALRPTDRWRCSLHAASLGTPGSFW